MREIKFRAWNDIDKIMVDLKKITPFATDIPGLFIPEKGVKPGYLIIEQFTGLKDKNGKEIYEGDVISCRDWETPKVVVFRGGSFGYEYPDDIFEPLFLIDGGIGVSDIEIIGNIHENPELVEVVK
jgi:uncharacterized phage protein (TIGR01671 family)